MREVERQGAAEDNEREEVIHEAGVAGTPSGCGDFGGADPMTEVMGFVPRAFQGRRGGGGNDRGLLSEFDDGLGDRLCRAWLGADEELLEALLGLHGGLDPSGDLSLDFDGAGGAASAERFAAVGSADDQADHAIEGFDSFDDRLALLGGGLVASAGGHGVALGDLEWECQWKG